MREGDNLQNTTLHIQLDTMKPDVYLLELALTTFLCFVAMVDMTSNRTIDILMPGVTTHEVGGLSNLS